MGPLEAARHPGGRLCVRETTGESAAEPSLGEVERDLSAAAERDAWVILLSVPGLGPVTFAGLLAAFGSARAALAVAAEAMARSACRRQWPMGRTAQTSPTATAAMSTVEWATRPRVAARAHQGSTARPGGAGRGAASARISPTEFEIRRLRPRRRWGSFAPGSSRGDTGRPGVPGASSARGDASAAAIREGCAGGFGGALGRGCGRHALAVGQGPDDRGLDRIRRSTAGAVLVSGLAVGIDGAGSCGRGSRGTAHGGGPRWEGMPVYSRGPTRGWRM